jgi:RNA polymerase sigma factor (sigma-70 family)
MVNMVDDAELLRRYVEEGSEEAFAGLVQRHLSLVYYHALRRTGGDAELAAEVCQGVFIQLAKKARSLRHHPVLNGWLFTTTRHLAINARVAEDRRRRREPEASTMQASSAEQDQPAEWERVRPMLCDTLEALRDQDRTVVLLRFFGGHPFPEIGRMLRISEEAARKRVDRALDKMQAALAQRGVTSTSAALGIALANQAAAIVVPNGLSASITTVALASVPSATGAASVIHFLTTMSQSKIIVGIAFAAAVAGIGSALYQTAEVRRLEAALVDANRTGRAQRTGLENRPGATGQETALANKQYDARTSRSDIVGQSGKTGVATAALTSVAPPISVLQRLKLITEMRQKRWSPIMGLFLGDDGKADGSFVSLFGLDPKEEARTQAAVDRARTKLAELERDHGVVTRDAEGNVVLKVQPFPSEGGKIYDQLLAEFSQILGPERYDAFRQIALQGCERSFGQFGIGERTYTFSHRDNTFTVNDRIITEGPNGPVFQSGTNHTFKTFDALVAYVGPIASALPADYHPKD